MVTLHEVITFLVSMQISISSLQTHNVNRCGRSRHLARKLSLRRKRSSPNVFEMAATETITSIILIKLIRVSLGTVRHPRRFKIVVIDIQITLKQMLRDFIGIRVNRAKKSGMVNITSSVNSRERSGINTILHELNPLFTINVTMRDIKSKNVYSRVNSKATTQWRKTESANGDRKSGSAGMPRPISYAVFCLKKKRHKKCGDHQEQLSHVGRNRIEARPQERAQAVGHGHGPAWVHRHALPLKTPTDLPA